MTIKDELLKELAETEKKLKEATQRWEALLPKAGEVGKNESKPSPDNDACVKAKEKVDAYESKAQELREKIAKC